MTDKLIEARVCTMKPSRQRLSLEAKKMWQPDQEISFNFISLVGGCPEDRLDEIEEVAMQWTQYANIRLRRIHDKGRAMIRIGFDPEGGSWSYIGTDVLSVGRLQPTMNFGRIDTSTPYTELSRVVLHEFGHALGCLHEHQNPAGNIPWNKEAVYEYYQRTSGWNKQLVDINIFETYDEDIVRAGVVDRDSIMMYAIPQELTVGDFSVGWNTCMSEGDKAFIRSVYPPATQ